MAVLSSHILWITVCSTVQYNRHYGLKITWKVASNIRTPVLRIRIRIHQIHLFLGLLDPDPDPLVRDMDPDPSIIKQK
jgi:hypothetical protein